ncbi:MAG: hypothetical protein HOV68_16250, partial [Streptomycetaceae bacterium]|nr:hypothetical protein [Streptomycetaceae bacterium]
MPTITTRVEDAVQRRSFLAGAAGVAAGLSATAHGRASARTGGDPAAYTRTT